METNKLIVACAAVVVTASLGIAEGTQEINDLSGATTKGKLTCTVLPPQQMLYVVDFKIGEDKYTGRVDAYKRLPYGKGILIRAIGTRYEGDFVNGKRHGNGSMTGVEGSHAIGSYEGGFVDDKWEGKGIITIFGIGRYEGDVVNAKKHGRGKITLCNGNSYEGDFVNSKKHGRGIARYSDGRSYEGDFMNDKRHGRGIERCSDGCSYEGDWENGKPHGKGFETDKNGTILRYGYYVHGEIDSSMAIDRPTPPPQRSSSSSVPTPGIFLRKCS